MYLLGKLQLGRATPNSQERCLDSNQFIQRDFLDEVRWQVTSLTDLNGRGEAWQRDYNHTHVHETIRCTPAERYRKGLNVDPHFLKQLFAKEERRKVTREATVRYHNRRFRVPEKYIGWHVWVANFFDQHIEIRAGSKTIGTFEL